ncbi:MAG: sulfotransferase [Pseudomonadota bacterium]
MSDLSFDVAHALHMRGRLDDARRAYQTLIAQDNDPQTVHWLGLLELQSGQLDRAIELLRQSVTLAPSAEYFANLGGALLAASKPKEAVDAFEAALERVADRPQTLAGLASARLQCGDREQAISLYRRAVKLDPQQPAIAHNLALALLADGRLTDAQRVTDNAIAACSPNDDQLLAALHLASGNARVGLGDYQRAMDSFQTVIDLAPNSPFGYHSLANMHRELGDADLAARHYETAIRLAPTIADGHVSLGVLKQEQGDMDGAQACFKNALKRQPSHGKAIRLLVGVSRDEPSEAERTAMRTFAADVRLPASDRAQIHFALGRIGERAHDYSQAFHHFEQGNRLYRDILDYSVDDDVTHMASVARTFTDEFVKEGTGFDAPASTMTPIFIVGMPRSGTSLLEQILASHSHVQGGGEVDWLMRDWREECAAYAAKHRPQDAKETLILSNETCLTMTAEFRDEQFARIGRRYLSRLEQHARAPYFVDKLPHNFMHIGLIKAAMPNAIVLHCERHPLATSWSLFKSFLGTHGNAFSFDLNDIARYYVSYHTLMQRWKTQSSTAVASIVYENLVRDPATSIRQALTACGLDWEDACLAFHRNRRAVRTLSATQVRRPMYTSALRQWTHYQDALSPLVQLFREHHIVSETALYAEGHDTQ